MIYGNLEEIKKYRGLSKNLDTAIDFISEEKYKNCEVGKNIIDGESVYFNCSEKIMTKDKEDIVEYHKRYIDIHIVLEGEEKIAYADFNESKEIKEYDIENDYALMKGEIKTELYMDTKKFLIIFPYEPHMALLKVKKTREIKKIVFKVEIE